MADFYWRIEFLSTPTTGDPDVIWFQDWNSLYSSPQALPRPPGCAGRRTAPQGSSAEHRQGVCFTPAFLPFNQGLASSSKTSPSGFLRQPTGHRRTATAAAPASAPSAARHQVRPPCPQYRQTCSLHSLEPTYRVVKMRMWRAPR